MPTPEQDTALPTERLRATFRLDLRAWVMMGVLVFAVFAAMGRLVFASFVDFDDQVYVYTNPRVLEGPTPSNLKWAVKTQRGRVWMPLTWMSLQIDAAISGHTDVVKGATSPLPSAMVYHVDNLLQQALTAVLLFLFLYRATRMHWPSFVIALIWTVHPLRVESVAWIAERKDVLSGWTAMLSLYWYVVWREKRRWVWYAASCGALAMSLLAKPTMVSMPILMMVLDYWPLGRIRGIADIWRLGLEKWGMIGLAVPRAVATWWIAHQANVIPTGFGTPWLGVTSYVKYIIIHIKTINLAIYYPYRQPGAWEIATAIVLLAVITLLCVRQRRSRPWMLAGWAWYVLAFVPMVGFVQVFSQEYADRFTYIPSIGLFMMIAYSIPGVWWTGRRLGMVLGVTAALAIVLTGFSMRQTWYWRNSVALFEHARDVTPPNSFTYRCLAWSYLRERQFDSAIGAFEQVTETLPGQSLPEVSIGLVYLEMGQPYKACGYLKAGVEKSPWDVDAHNFYGIALLRTGKYAEAVAEFKQTLNIMPQNSQAAGLMHEAMEKMEKGGP